MGPELYGVEWRNFKLALAVQKYLTDPVGKLPSPHIINLVADPQEREPLKLPYLHSWTAYRFNRLLAGYQASVKRDAPVPAGALLGFISSPTPMVHPRRHPRPADLPGHAPADRPCAHPRPPCRIG